MKGFYFDWEILVEPYNKRFGTDCKNVEEMVRHCYGKHKSVHRAAEVFGCSHGTVRRFMVMFDIPRQRRFGNPIDTTKSRLDKAGLTKEIVKNMTSREIADIIGKSVDRVCTALKFYDYDWKRKYEHYRYR